MLAAVATFFWEDPKSEGYGSIDLSAYLAAHGLGTNEARDEPQQTNCSGSPHPSDDCFGIAGARDAPARS
jgi:hypothetical protein